MKEYRLLRVHAGEEQTLHRALTDYRRILDLSSLAPRDKSIVEEETHRATSLLNRVVMMEHQKPEPTEWLTEEDVDNAIDAYNLNAAFHEFDRECLWEAWNLFDDARDAVLSGKHDSVEDLLVAVENMKAAHDELLGFIDRLEERERQDYEDFQKSWESTYAKVG
jgi:hypothetical protein